MKKGFELLCLGECRRSETLRNRFYVLQYLIIMNVHLRFFRVFREEKGGHREKSSKTL
jgi:hypothetical protein